MRKGVLADNYYCEPLSFKENIRHFAVPNIQKTTLVTRPRKSGHRNIPRPRDTHAAHYMLAQLLDPLNPKKHIEAFADQMALAINPQPSPTFRGLVEQFHHDNTSFEMMSSEKAYFLEKLNLDPDKYYLDSIGRRMNKKMKEQELIFLFEKIVNEKARDNSLTPEELHNFDQAYEEATAPFNKMPVKETKKTKEEVEPSYVSFSGTPILTDDPSLAWLPENYQTRSPAPPTSSDSDLETPASNAFTPRMDDRGERSRSTQSSESVQGRATSFLGIVNRLKSKNTTEELLELV